MNRAVICQIAMPGGCRKTGVVLTCVIPAKAHGRQLRISHAVLSTYSTGKAPERLQDPVRWSSPEISLMIRKNILIVTQ
jgi:hypothetical protein